MAAMALFRKNLAAGKLFAGALAAPFSRNYANYPLVDWERPGNYHEEIGRFCNHERYGGGRGDFEVGGDWKSLRVRFDMPGLREEHVKVWAEGDVLWIKGEGPKAKGVVSREWVDMAKGRLYGIKLPLPAGVFKLSEIHTEFENGVLKVCVPKIEVEEEQDGDVEPV